jgi:hypothetical protein
MTLSTNFITNINETDIRIKRQEERLETLH